jgi:hypothetical protein
MTRPHHSTVIHIEGMDLAGKSTVTRSLHEAVVDAQLRRNSLIDGNRIFALADELRRADAASARVLGHLYVAALAEDLEQVSAPSGPLIQDSTILLRSLAYNEAIGAHDIVEALLRLVPRHPTFGATVVLTASLEARAVSGWRAVADSPPPRWRPTTSRSSSTRSASSGWRGCSWRARRNSSGRRSSTPPHCRRTKCCPPSADRWGCRRSCAR